MKEAPKNTFILGLGRSGWSTFRFLKQENWSLWIWDDCPKKRQNIPEDLQALVRCPVEKDWNQVDTFVVSPGIGLQHPLVREAGKWNGLRPIGDIELFFRLFPQVQAVGVTGSNGKSTTCSMLEKMLSFQGIPCVLAGNIGTPVFDCVAYFSSKNMPQDLNSQSQKSPLLILELSSYQLECLSFAKLSVGAWLNFSPHHLERHGTLQGYFSAKRKIIDHSEKVVLFCDPEMGIVQHLYPLSQKEKEKILWIGQENPASLKIKSWGLETQTQEFSWGQDEKCLKILSKGHNRNNLAAAYGICIALGIKPSSDFLADFSELPHRQEEIATIRTIRYINDSKATSPHAVLQAFQSFRPEDRVVWIAGGVLQNDDLSVLENKVHQHVIAGIFLGQASDRYYVFLKALGIPAYLCENLEEAFHRAQSIVTDHNILLFSPGCASFDQFQDFEQRGDRFRQLVHAYEKSFAS